MADEDPDVFPIGARFGERPEFGAPGARSCSERRAFTANYEMTEFSFAIGTSHLAEGLEVEVALLGDQPREGFLSLTVYREFHLRPTPDQDPGPAHVLALETQVMTRFAERLAALLGQDNAQP